MARSRERGLQGDEALTDPAIASDYTAAYEGTRRNVAARSLPELHDALYHFTPKARSETDFGIIDALADLVREAIATPPPHPPAG